MSNEFQPPADCDRLSGIGLALVMRTMVRGKYISSGWSLFVILAAIAGAGFLAVTASSKVPAGGADDWRRTATGWQRATAWPTAIDFQTVSVPSPASGGQLIKSQRFDTHPAVLAFLQLLGALAALSIFAAPAPQSFRGWLSMLTQSFRASAFGS